VDSTKKQLPGPSPQNWALRQDQKQFSENFRASILFRSDFGEVGIDLFSSISIKKLSPKKDKKDSSQKDLNFLFSPSFLGNTDELVALLVFAA